MGHLTVLGLDPLSVARRSATGLTESGERAIVEARGIASERLDRIVTSERRKPLQDQLAFRLYRSVAVGKAKAAAYVELAYERFFSGIVLAEGRSGEPPPRPFRS